jgi:hypothetical protein
MHPYWFSKNKSTYNEAIKNYLSDKLEIKRLNEIDQQIYEGAVEINDKSMGASVSNNRNSNYLKIMISSITDDKTALAIMNADETYFPDKKDAEYYKESDWSVQSEKYNDILYPNQSTEKRTSHESIIGLYEGRSDDFKPQSLNEKRESANSPFYSSNVKEYGGHQYQSSGNSEKNRNRNDNKNIKSQRRNIGSPLLFALIIFLAVFVLFVVVCIIVLIK